MMNKVMTNIQRYVRIRKLHTIISQETIKPSFPTPLHLKTHNLSLIDYLSPHLHVPWVFFFKNYNNGDINKLKKSLSKSLTHYYPFAGRLLGPQTIDCNDEGVEFVEASIHSPLDEFMRKRYQDETFDQLVPNALGCLVNKTSPNIAAVQLSYFSCGGAAVGVSISHMAGDAFTMLSFVNHWATITRGGSPLSPTFFTSSTSNYKIPEFPIEFTIAAQEEAPKLKYATRRFVFPNSKLSALKNKINAMGTRPVNPTRVESLTSLLFKCAAATKPMSSQPISLNRMVNVRGKTNANIPELALGNLYAMVTTKIMDSSRMQLNEVVTSMRNGRMEVEGVREVEDIGKMMVNAWLTLMRDHVRTYGVSSVCRFPLYQVDFGWGKPVRVMLRSGGVEGNVFVLMDTPPSCGEGIEATVHLEEKEMSVFQEDKELQTYAEDD
ncbi:putative salutaridinol 7-O-acetyltransferase [Helianthus debilis subsp. tardiflorus]